MRNLQLNGNGILHDDFAFIYLLDKHERKIKTSKFITLVLENNK